MVTVEHWGKDVVTKLFLMLFLILSCQAMNSQKVTGNYTSIVKEGSKNLVQNINFKENGEFIYSSSSGHSDDLGKEGFGHYYIHKRNLKLDFDLTGSKRNSKNIINRKESIYDSIFVSFEVIEQRVDGNKPFGGGYFICNDKNVKAFFTDKDGKATIKLAKSNDEYTFTHFSIGLPQLSTLIKLDADYSIKMEIDSNEPNPIENEVMNFKIKKIKRNFIVLKKENGKKIKFVKRN